MQVDVKHFMKATVLLQWMGMNALIIYALGACDFFSAGLQGFYWRSPENNLVILSFFSAGKKKRKNLNVFVCCNLLIFLVLIVDLLDDLSHWLVA